MSPILIAIAFAQAATSLPAGEPPKSSGPVAMGPEEIKAHNANYQRSDPAYIRCQQILQTGSLVKKVKICQTNARWRKTDESGNRTARATVEASQSSFIVN